MDFDEMLTSSARLAILASLVSGAALSFMQLKRETGLADGNLHVQTRKLADAAYIEIQKIQRGKRGLTQFQVTDLGVAALKLHVRKLLAILSLESGEIQPSPGPGKSDDSQVWS